MGRDCIRRGGEGRCDARTTVGKATADVQVCIMQSWDGWELGGGEGRDEGGVGRIQTSEEAEKTVGGRRISLFIVVEIFVTENGYISSAFEPQL